MAYMAPDIRLIGVWRVERAAIAIKGRLSILHCDQSCLLKIHSVWKYSNLDFLQFP